MLKILYIQNVQNARCVLERP